MEEIHLRSTCGHTATAKPVRKVSGSQAGKLQIRISGPHVKGASGVKCVYSDPSADAAAAAMAMFLRVARWRISIKGENYVSVPTPLGKRSLVQSDILLQSETKRQAVSHSESHSEDTRMIPYKLVSKSRRGVSLHLNGQELGTVCSCRGAHGQHEAKAPRLEPDTMQSTPTEEQQVIIDMVVQQRKSCFISGEAGTGKSFILRYIEEGLAKVCAPGSVHMTASTGLAAVILGGCTVHSFAGIGLGEGSREMLIGRAIKTAGKRWCEAECLIIDEVSMLSGDLLDLLDAVGRAARRKPDIPFGGLQIVLCGDFCQLGPVKVQGTREYAFEAAVWDKVIEHHFCLNRNLRQDGDSFFSGILREIRQGHVSQSARDAFMKCTRDLPADNGVLPTKLYCTNRDVDAENAAELAKLPGDMHRFTALDQGPTSSREALAKACSAPKVLELKVGAQVVLLKNLTGTQLVNGSRGVVQSFSQGGLPVVLFDNGLQTEIAPKSWDRGHSTNKASREQVPLRLAWAITVHRCQGMTLDKVECSLVDAFAAGQVYVALSRVRSLVGLQLRSLDISKVRVAAQVTAFYQSSRFSTHPITNSPTEWEEDWEEWDEQKYEEAQKLQHQAPRQSTKAPLKQESDETSPQQQPQSQDK